MLNLAPNMHKPIIDHSIEELLQELGKGKGMPGAVGSTTVSALIGLSILESVCKITIGSKNYVNIHSKAMVTLNKLHQHQKELKRLAQQDVNAVNSMILDKKITSELSTTPFEICRICITVLEDSFFLYREAYQRMKGDTITALLMISSAATATLHISKSNLAKATISGNDVLELSGKLYDLQQELKQLTD